MSIYEKIIENIDNGLLKEGFSLDISVDGERFEDGEADALLLYGSEEEIDISEEDEKLMVDALKKAGAGKKTEAEKAFTLLGQKVRAVLMAEDMQEYVIKNSGRFNPDKIYDTAQYLMMNSEDIEAVKYGMCLLELLPIDDGKLKYAVKQIGLCSEFTLFSVWIMKYWDNGNEEIFSLAQKVGKWGRNHCANWLEPENEEINEWIAGVE